MASINQMKKLEIALLSVAIVGAPSIQFIWHNSQPFDPDTVTCSLPFGKGDKLTLSISSYQLDYVIQGTIPETYEIETGVFLRYYYQSERGAFLGVSILKFIDGTAIKNLALTIQIIEANKTHAIAQVVETDLTFPIQLASIYSLHAALPQFAPGIKLSDKNATSKAFIAFFPVYVFPTDLSRAGLEHEAQKKSVNAWEKIEADTFHFPRDEANYSSYGFYPPQCDRTWTFYPHSTRLKKITAFHEEPYLWKAEDHAQEGLPEGITIQATMAITLEWQYN
ncbi:MAG: hypothetical protein ACFFB3_04375 [Candidatus Hodarchaeota archaeon]